MSTKDNLQESFAGESQANRKYLAFGDQAARDGMAMVAKLFRAVAAAETLHAHAHLRAMDGVKDTLSNLKEAMAGEAHEVAHMYPPMLAAAIAEGHKRAERSMSYALEVEKVHFGLFQQALSAVQAGKDLTSAAIRICPVCGHTVIGDAPDECPVCKVKGEKFTEIS
ncbi:MAG: rubrerythrin family protein [Alphaproteobacteria bacterium]|nr:rubrerythrin family protein [Alphaproteobacteria bacterium]